MKPIVTAEDQLKLLRAGYDQVLELKYGQLVVRCRLLPHSEEADVIANAKASVKVPKESDREFKESAAVLRATIKAACTVDGTPQVSDRFLEQLTDVELDTLYDQYLTHKNMANKEFEKLTPDELRELVTAVKKKERATSDLFTWQLAAVGKYFLDHLLPEASVPGS